MFHYEISWNSFQAHLASHQSQLYEDKVFADVTLVTDDMTSFKAHKTVLSGASDLFKDLFMLDTSSQPLIFIRGIEKRELEALLKFIYLGKCQLHENNLHKFTKTGLELGIRELQNGIKPEDNELFQNNVDEQIVENKNDTLVIEEDTFIGTQKLSYLDMQSDKVSSDSPETESTKLHKQKPLNGRLAKKYKETNTNDEIPVIQKEIILNGIKETVQNMENMEKDKTPLVYDPVAVGGPDYNSPNRFYKMVKVTEEDMLRQQEEKKHEIETKRLQRLQNKDRKKRGRGRPRLDVSLLQCNYCHYKASSQWRLQQHVLRNHNAACQELNCGFISLKLNNLQDHNEIEHPGKVSRLVFQCSTCSYRTSRNSDLIKHEGRCSFGKKADILMSL